MFKQVRKKVVSSITNVGRPDQFEWNKWLRPPLNEYYVPQSISSGLYDFEEIDLFIPVPDHQKENIKLPKVKLYKSSKKTEFTKTRVNPVFFGLGKSSTKKVDIDYPDKNKLFYSLSILNDGGQIFYKVKKADIEEKTVEKSAKIYTPAFKHKILQPKKVVIKFPELKQKSFDAKLEIPVITDHLSKLKPKILKIDLLSIDSLVKPGKSNIIDLKRAFIHLPPRIISKKILDVAELIGQKTKSIVLKKNFIESVSKTPKVFKVKVINLSSVKVPTYFLKNIFITSNGMMPRYFYPTGKTRIREEKFILTPLPHQSILFGDSAGVKKEYNLLEEKIKNLLEPTIEFNEYEIAELFKNLLPYQKLGAEFLINNNHTMLTDELGLGKTIQAIFALKLLLKKGEIKSALIITDSSETGDAKLSLKTGQAIGWSGHAAKYLPEFSHNVVYEKIDDSHKWKKSSNIYITSYDCLFNDIQKKIVDKERLQRFDCVVFDEAQNLLNNYFGLANAFTAATKHLWCLSSLPPVNIENELKTIFNSNPPVLFEGNLRRRKYEVSKEILITPREDFWIDLDDDQKKEFNAALKTGQKQISEFIEKGNPYRFQANVFFLIHQLNQICNFSENKDSSKKTDLLLKHIDIIAKNEQKVIIFSQYDKFGTQKIENTLTNNGIKYVRYIGGMSAGAMEAAVKSFKNDKKIPVFLASLKAAGVKYNLSEIPYIIHFDQWWNPISQWQAEERLGIFDKVNSQSEEQLNVYNYISKNPVELNIRELLHEKGLLNKNLIESLSAESIYNLVTMDDWMSILGITKVNTLFNKEEILESAENKIKSFNYEQLGEKVKVFLSKLGYKNLVIKEETNKKDLTITGLFNKNGTDLTITAKTFCKDLVTQENVDEVSSVAKTPGKVFIFTNGLFDEDIKVKDNVSLISVRTFASYITSFQI